MKIEALSRERFDNDYYTFQRNIRNLLDGCEFVSVEFGEYKGLTITLESPSKGDFNTWLPKEFVDKYIDDQLGWGGYKINIFHNDDYSWPIVPNVPNNTAVLVMNSGDTRKEMDVLYINSHEYKVGDTIFIDFEDLSIHILKWALS